MEQRIFHGDLTPNDVANALIAQFNRGNLRAQAFGDDRSMKVQIATRQGAASGGQTAITVQVQRTSDGVMVTVGQQAWMGVAASMGKTLFATLRNPWSLLDRLDDIAQDIENLQISENVWQVVGKFAKSRRASTQISERLQRAVCEYCGTPNAVGAGGCIACGAPLGNVQPRTCAGCGFVVLRGERICPGCGKQIPV